MKKIQSKMLQFAVKRIGHKSFVNILKISEHFETLNFFRNF